MTRAPNLIVLGAPKAGTTAIAHYLRQHPDIFVAKRKEMNFFASDLPSRHAISAQEYFSEFEAWQDQPFGADVSVNYLCSTTAASEIRRTTPEAHLIMLLRNPSDAIPAFHKTLLWTGNEDREDLNEALRLEPERASGRSLPPGVHVHPTILQYRSMFRYAEQIERYKALFPESQLHVALLDDFRSDTAGTMNRLFAAIGLPPLNHFNTEPQNESKVIRNKTLHRLYYHHLVGPRRAIGALLPQSLRRSLVQSFRAANTVKAKGHRQDEVRARLALEFATEVDKLEGLIGRDLSAWKPSAQ